MKKTYSIYFIAFISLLFFSSCEKGIDTIEFESTVYLPNAGLSAQTVLLGESIFELGVYRAGINQTEGDITVTLKVDQAAFSTFQASNPGYEILPESYYSIESTSVIIAEDKECETCKIHLKGIDDKFISKNYILPISIASITPSVSTLEEGQTAFLYFSKYRNAYECKYKAFGATSPAGDKTTSTTIDEVVTATTATVNSIKVKGAESNLYLNLTILDSGVAITGATGSEAYNVVNTAGKTSTYTGEFDRVYQGNKGKFILYYSYTKNGLQMDAEVELNFWL